MRIYLLVFNWLLCIRCRRVIQASAFQILRLKIRRCGRCNIRIFCQEARSGGSEVTLGCACYAAVIKLSETPQI